MLPDRPRVGIALLAWMATVVLFESPDPTERTGLPCCQEEWSGERLVISSFLFARKGWVWSVNKRDGCSDDLSLFFPFRLVWETV